jgi:hypothetical protein
MKEIPEMLEAHNKKVTASAIISDTSEHTGPVCILLSNGSLYGPFESATIARYWAISQELVAFSTYDLLSPSARKD